MKSRTLAKLTSTLLFFLLFISVAITIPQGRLTVEAAGTDYIIKGQSLHLSGMWQNCALGPGTADYASEPWYRSETMFIQAKSGQGSGAVLNDRNIPQININIPNMGIGTSGISMSTYKTMTIVYLAPQYSNNNKDIDFHFVTSNGVVVVGAGNNTLAGSNGSQFQNYSPFHYVTFDLTKFGLSGNLTTIGIFPFGEQVTAEGNWLYIDSIIFSQDSSSQVGVSNSTLYQSLVERLSARNGTYNIYYQSRNGTQIAAQSVVKGFNDDYLKQAPTSVASEEDSFYNYVWDGGWSWVAENTYRATYTSTAKEYKITYDTNGGDTISAKNYSASSKKTLGTPTRTGYTFTGWKVTSNGGNWTDTSYTANKTTSEMYGNVTLQAQWRLNTYTVAFNKNNGSGSMPNMTFTYGTAQNLTANSFSRTGYTFSGWNTSADGKGTSYSNQQNVNNLTTADGATITLYAQWTAITYTVSYNANNGSGTTNSSTHTYDVAKTLTANGFSRTGYTFLGWSTNKDATTATYTDKQSVSNLSSTKGATVTLYAIWQRQTYTVTVAAGTGISSISGGGTYNSGATVTITALVKPGYSWKNWTGSSTQEAQTYTFTISSNVSFTANGTPIQYHVQFVKDMTPDNGVDNFENFIETGTYTIESGIALPSTSMAGYNYVWVPVDYDTLNSGWDAHIRKTEYAPGATIDPGRYGTVLFCAYARPINYTISYRDSNGTTVISTDNYTVESAQIDLYIPSREGYKFCGWTVVSSSGTNSLPVGGLLPYDESRPNDPNYSQTSLSRQDYGNIVLKANWTIITYTITWDVDGNKTTVTVNHGDTPSYGSTPTKESTAQYDYTFTGWSPEIVAATANATYTAQFSSTVRSYTITWTNYDDSVITTTIVEYGTLPSYTGETPIRPNEGSSAYTFEGWTPEIVAVTGAATYKATFVATLSAENLTISLFCDDPNQQFEFTLKDSEGNVVVTFTLCDGRSVTIRDLPIGEYTITNNADWSWRFINQSNEKTVDTADDGIQTISFTYTTTNPAEGNIVYQTQWINSLGYSAVTKSKK